MNTHQPFTFRLLLASVTVLFVAACSSDSPNSTSATEGGSSSGDSCTADTQCAKGEYCATSDDGMCGPISRTCEIYPASCGESILRTVCGCDGKSHSYGSCPS